VVEDAAEAFLFLPFPDCCPNSPEAPVPVTGAATTSAVLLFAAAGSVVIDDVDDTDRVVVALSLCASKAALPWSIIARSLDDNRSSVA
jgi:hypothetical protein